tara:strand:+ start:3016 stop:3279 length:264 start_codon:yes stop_codon:yes gene_type:complete
MEANPLNGRPWEIKGRFKTFEEADKRRNQLKNKENLQVKVKKLKESYVVKIRTIVVEEKKGKKRNKSKRRDKSFYMLDNYKGVQDDS